MGSILRSKKAFLYFGGGFIILLGGAIILLAPYHYIGFVATPPDAEAIGIWDQAGYYPRLEVSVSARPLNVSIVNIDFRIVNNATLAVVTLNMTLTKDNEIPGSNPPVFDKRAIVDLEPGDYTVYIDGIEGATYFDLGLTQVSDSRTYIVTGGSLNLIGLAMCIGGYFVSGTLLPTGDETIVGWGYDEEKEE